jgi:hypothetical protein
MFTQALNRLMYALKTYESSSRFDKGFWLESEKEDMGVVNMAPRRAKVVNMY